MNSDNLRFIMGFKIKQLRQEKGFSLKDVAGKTNLSISYLSEIEKGKKYPKPEKILLLSQALAVPYDELVSLKVKKELDPLPIIFSSPVIKEFPFRMYGFSPQDLLSLITGDPGKAGAFIRTLLEIGRSYNMHVEQLLFAALRSYQQMHHNYFDDVESAVSEFVNEKNWSQEPPVSLEKLQAELIENYGYEIDETQLSKRPELAELRYVFANGAGRKLLLRASLDDIQKKMILARELGYQKLGLKDRAMTSSWLDLKSFDQLVNNFKATYFAGALLMNREMLCNDLAQFLQQKRWNGMALAEMIHKYDVAPEMFLHRVSELLPQFFGVNNFLSFRFSNIPGSDHFEMSNLFNMSNVSIPHAIDSQEHYCRRWTGIRLLKELAAGQQQDLPVENAVAGAQRAKFIDLGVEMFTITMARPSTMEVGKNASGTISFVMDEHFKRAFSFWKDPDIPIVEVNETCERCSFSAEKCKDRAVAPFVYEKQQALQQQKNVLNDLLQGLK